MRAKEIWLQLWKPLADYWQKGSEESKEAAYLRAMREANQVSVILDSEGWNVLRTRLAGKLLEDLNLLDIQMRSGKLSDSEFAMKVAAICATPRFMEQIRQVLLEGQVAEEELKKIAAKQAEQAATPSVENLAAEG